MATDIGAGLLSQGISPDNTSRIGICTKNRYEVSNRGYLCKLCKVRNCGSLWGKNCVYEVRNCGSLSDKELLFFIG